MASPDASGGSPHFYIMYKGAEALTEANPEYVGIQTTKEKLAEFALTEIDAKIYPAEDVTIYDILADQSGLLGPGYISPEIRTKKVTPETGTPKTVNLVLRKTLTNARNGLPTGTNETFSVALRDAEKKLIQTIALKAEVWVY